MRGRPDHNGIHSPLQKVIFRTYGSYNPRSVPQPYYSPVEQPDTNFTVTGLQPFTEYQFLVTSSNTQGSADSPWETGRTLEGGNLFMYLYHIMHDIICIICIL